MGAITIITTDWRPQIYLLHQHHFQLSLSSDKPQHITRLQQIINYNLTHAICRTSGLKAFLLIGPCLLTLKYQREFGISPLPIPSFRYKGEGFPEDGEPFFLEINAYIKGNIGNGSLSQVLLESTRNVPTTTYWQIKPSHAHTRSPLLLKY